MPGKAPSYDDLARRVEELTDRLASLERAQGTSGTPDAPITRRRMLRTAAATSAGTVAAVALAGMPSAYAAPSDPVVQGATNVAGASTTTLRSASTTSVLTVNATAEGNAVYGLASSTGRAIVGYVATPTSTASAIYGSTAGTGVGVEGKSDNGRGGKFTGRYAQINLAPGTSSTYPSHGGILGDLYVDLTARLWFCRGQNKWVQVV